MPGRNDYTDKKMPYSTHTLSNGLRIIHAPSPTDVVYCGFAVNAGTRDELPHEQGMAHFVEHLIFKGTRKRHAWHILNRMENVGGDLNAYTNKEETIIYSAFLKEHFSRAAELLTDIVFNSTFPQQEIEKEVEVIIDEIRSYEDSPSELIFDDFEELIFPDHPLGRNILGKPDLLRQFRSEDALEFVHRHYRPSNMVFFITGNIPFEKTVMTMEKIMQHAGIHPDSGEENKRTAPLPFVPRKVVMNKDTHQSHIMIGTRGYDTHDERHTGLYLLNNILGGPGMNSRLNIALREQRGLVYNVESNLTSYTDTEIFSIYFGCDHKNEEKCISLVHKELEKIYEKPITSFRLNAAKKQLIGQIGVASDNFENNALEMGKCFLHYHKCEEKKEVSERIESLTPECLQKIAEEMFSEKHLSTLIYH